MTIDISKAQVKLKKYHVNSNFKTLKRFLNLKVAITIENTLLVGVLVKFDDLKNLIITDVTEYLHLAPDDVYKRNLGDKVICKIDWIQSLNLIKT